MLHSSYLCAHYHRVTQRDQQPFTVTYRKWFTGLTYHLAVGERSGILKEAQRDMERQYKLHTCLWLESTHNLVYTVL